MVKDQHRRNLQARQLCLSIGFANYRHRPRLMHLQYANCGNDYRDRSKPLFEDVRNFHKRVHIVSARLLWKGGTPN